MNALIITIFTFKIQTTLFIPRGNSVYAVHRDHAYVGKQSAGQKQVDTKYSGVLHLQSILAVPPLYSVAHKIRTATMWSASRTRIHNSLKGLSKFDGRQNEGS